MAIALLAALACLPGLARAQPVRATSLSSFERLEDSTLIYVAAASTFQAATEPRITEPSPGVFRMSLRYDPARWDGDSATRDPGRQRAEAKGLGPRQKPGDTFLYKTTWRSSPGFRGLSDFCVIFQLKALDGEKDIPVVTLSLPDGAGVARVKVKSGTSAAGIIVREFHWTPGRWQRVAIRVKIGERDGEAQVSVDGGPFSGRKGLPVFRMGSTIYRPKWGLYRRVSRRLSVGESWIEHKEVSAEKL